MKRRMCNRQAILLAVCFPLFSLLHAAPVTADRAGDAAEGWLRLSQSRPFNATLRPLAEAEPEPITDDTGRTVGFVFHLASGGYLVTSADSEVEPIIVFSPNGSYLAEPDNPIHSILSYDLAHRTTAATDKLRATTLSDSTAALKWQTYTDAAVVSKDTVVTLSNNGKTLVSDIRVAPLLNSQWDSFDTGEDLCFTTYTPHNYPAGYVPVAWAQIMRYHGYPTNGIGVHAHTISVDSVSQWASTRGGDGSGGPYRWDLMSRRSTPNLSEANQQAIGALVSDIGIAISTNVDGDVTTYTAAKTDSYMPTTVLTNLFGYGSAFRFDAATDPTNAINPNLDARLPLALLLYGDTGGEHAVVCDGYGYHDGALYHHLNMGALVGAEDLWYALPNVRASDYYVFTNLTAIYANIYPSGSGEIISGRVLADDLPVSHATVTLAPGGRTVLTDGEGIYAFTKVASATPYTLSAQKTCYVFSTISVTTGTSTNASASCGNRWNRTFNGTLATDCHLVSGTVMNESGIGLGRSTLTFSSASVTAETDLEGIWHCAFPNGWSGSVTPDVGPGYTVPVAQAISDLQDDVTGISFLGIPVRYVRATALGSGTGRSWANAWTTLNVGLREAPDNAELWVAQSRYTLPSYSRRTTFLFPSGRRAYGGFAGFETRRDQRNWTTNVTTLSGDIGTLGDVSDNCKTVVSGAVGGRLDGFTVTEGNADSIPANAPFESHTMGGGIYESRSTTIPDNPSVAFLVDHCTVISNQAFYGSATVGCVLRNTLLVNNHALSFAVAQYSRLENCTVVNNTVGASFLSGVAMSAAANCIIWGNQSFWPPDDTNCSYTCDVYAPEGFNNITDDPLFEGAATNNYRILSNSPCVNLGTNFFWMATAQDLAGNSRIYNDVPDMGAYEYQILHPAYAITATASDEAGFAVSVATLAGWTYSLRYKDDLSDPEWANLTQPVTVLGDDSVKTLRDPDWGEHTHRFYKIDTSH